MNKFLFKSTDADFKKIYQLTETIQKNVLYLTHQVDYIRQLLVKDSHDKDLQSTVDKYFEETSPQTDDGSQVRMVED